jgi:DMSO/TMAO reductase YedYZ heme-binding membrane subunit
MRRSTAPWLGGTDLVPSSRDAPTGMDMRTGIVSRTTLVRRHLGMAAISALLVYVFYLSYGAWGVQPALWPDWGQDHPFWRAWAHAAFVLLFLTLILSPASTFFRPIRKLLPWRRELGIWFAVLSLGHAYAIWDRWARWDVATLFGFQHVEELDRYVLVRPEVGIMNVMGMVMLPMIVLLAVTSFDRAVSFLGASSWKWIHRTLVHVIFYIAMLRGVLYFFYLFQTTPPEWRVYPSIWFLHVFLGMGVVAVSLQGAAFARTVLRRRRQREEVGVGAIVAMSAVVVLFAMPLVLLWGTVAYFDSRALEEDPTFASQAPSAGDARARSPEGYARTFEMTLHGEGQDDRLWVSDLDGELELRLTTEVGGSPVSHRIYRSSERAWYVAERGPDAELTWSRTDDVGPEDLGLVQMVREPAAWAAQHGRGRHRIEVPDGVLQVTVHSVEVPIDAEVFEVPADAESLQR